MATKSGGAPGLGRISIHADQNGPKTSTGNLGAPCRCGLSIAMSGSGHASSSAFSCPLTCRAVDRTSASVASSTAIGSRCMDGTPQTGLEPERKETGQLGFTIGQARGLASRNQAAGDIGQLQLAAGHEASQLERRTVERLVTIALGGTRDLPAFRFQRRQRIGRAGAGLQSRRTASQRRPRWRFGQIRNSHSLETGHQAQPPWHWVSDALEDRRGGVVSLHGAVERPIDGDVANQRESSAPVTARSAKCHVRTRMPSEMPALDVAWITHPAWAHSQGNIISR